MVRALAIISGLALSLSSSALHPSSAEASGLARKRHVVKAGDTLHELAQRYGCSVSELRKANQLGEVLPVGKTLRIPACGQPASEARLDPRARRAQDPRGASKARTVAEPPASAHRARGDRDPLDARDGRDNRDGRASGDDRGPRELRDASKSRDELRDASKSRDERQARASRAERAEPRAERASRAEPRATAVTQRHRAEVDDLRRRSAAGAARVREQSEPGAPDELALRGQALAERRREPRNDDRVATAADTTATLVASAAVVLPSQVDEQRPPDDLPVVTPELAPPSSMADHADDDHADDDHADDGHADDDHADGARPQLPGGDAPDVRLDNRSLRSLTPAVPDLGPDGEGQSVGLPWRGRLRAASRLEPGDGYVIRRQHRTWGTASTIEHVRWAIAELRRKFPTTHELAVGDLSAEHGGPISDHRSHQSGRDIDLGLVFRDKPAGYPDAFVVGTEATLDAAATWALIDAFADTAELDGGASMIFLDYAVQGIVYRWAEQQGVDSARLARVFQYPNGKHASSGLVRHAPNHADHLHVRFRCASAEPDCHK